MVLILTSRAGAASASSILSLKSFLGTACLRNCHFSFRRLGRGAIKLLAKLKKQRPPGRPGGEIFLIYSRAT